MLLIFYDSFTNILPILLPSPFVSGLLGSTITPFTQPSIHDRFLIRSIVSRLIRANARIRAYTPFRKLLQETCLSRHYRICSWIIEGGFLGAREREGKANESRLPRTKLPKGVFIASGRNLQKRESWSPVSRDETWYGSVIVVRRKKGTL